MAPRTVGIIGLGFGRAHIPAFQSHGCQVVAVCQRDQKVARVIADRYGVPTVFERWEEMLREARPDIVVIASPPVLHRAIALEALAGGAHVLCEKPLAMNVGECRDMIAAAEQAGRVAMTGFNWRFPAAMQRFHAIVEAGGVGRLFQAHLRFFAPRWVDETTAPTWRMDRAQAGHGAMGDMGVHMIDLVRWNFGEFKQLAAQAGIAYPTRTVPGGDRAADAEDYCSVIAELASGAQVTLSVNRSARGITLQSVEAFGSEGALEYRLDRDKARWWKGELRYAGKTGNLAPVKLAAGLPRTATKGDPLEVTGKATIGPLVKRFLAAIRKKEAASPSFEDGMRAQAVLDAIGESIASGGRMVSI